MVLCSPLLPSCSHISFISWLVWSLGTGTGTQLPWKAAQGGSEERDLRRGVSNVSFGVGKWTSFALGRKTAGWASSREQWFGRSRYRRKQGGLIRWVCSCSVLQCWTRCWFSALQRLRDTGLSGHPWDTQSALMRSKAEARELPRVDSWWKNTLGWAWSEVRSFSVEHRNAVGWMQEDQHSWFLASWLEMDELVWIKQQLVWLLTDLQLSLNLEGSKQDKAYIINFILTQCHLSVAPGCSKTAERQWKDGTFLGWLERKRSFGLPITGHVSIQKMFFSEPKHTLKYVNIYHFVLYSIYSS